MDVGKPISPSASVRGRAHVSGLHWSATHPLVTVRPVDPRRLGVKRTDGIVFHHAHGLRGAWTAEGVEEARHGLREQTDDYDAGFRCRGV